MYLKKLIIESQTGHFGQVLGYDDRLTYNVPPPSTVIGMLKVIFGDDIDNFKFGYLFKSEQKFTDDITIHKRKSDGSRMKNKQGFVSDIRSIDYLYNCSLIIYTDIKLEPVVNYILTMGKSGNPAKLNFPIREVELIDKEGKGFNQYTTKHIGSGRISSYNMLSKYNTKFDSYDNQIEFLRFNEEFNNNKNYDVEEEQNVFMWKVKDGKVTRLHD